VSKLMAKRPNERYQTPAELILDLAALSPSPVASASPVPPQVIPVAETCSDAPPPTAILMSRMDTFTAPPPSPPEPWRGRIWIAAIVIFSLLLLGLLVCLF
jgi:hypothetical protein